MQGFAGRPPAPGAADSAGARGAAGQDLPAADQPDTMNSRTFVDDSSRLRFTDAVGVILLDPRGRYLLQHRDDKSGIWFPDHWGLFGGALEPGESPRAALGRELGEELGLAIDPARAAFFMRQAYDLGGVGLGLRWRHIYALELADGEASSMKLGEGRAMAWHDGADALAALRITPYDSFALFLHHARARIV
jgi:8-oxo-dGTP pyrophosphatase MutT (NUDIX family)